MPNGNRITDADIIAQAIHDEGVVVTKGADFVNSFLVAHQPPKLLLISAGNIRNADLEVLLVAHLPAIVAAFTAHDYVEMTRAALIIHA
jgi:predicted nuclease of predicted toxin-antitoxin system